MVEIETDIMISECQKDFCNTHVFQFKLRGNLQQSSLTIKRNHLLTHSCLTKTFITNSNMKICTLTQSAHKSLWGKSGEQTHCPLSFRISSGLSDASEKLAAARKEQWTVRRRPQNAGKITQGGRVYATIYYDDLLPKGLRENSHLLHGARWQNK